MSASSRILRGEVLADAGNRAQLLRRRMPATGVGPGGDDVSAADAVRANLERVLALDLEQVGDLAEHLRDRRGYPRASPWRSNVKSSRRAPPAGERLADRVARRSGGP